MYIKKTYYTGKVVEGEKVQTFRYHGKKTSRGPVVKKTPEKMAACNERNCGKKLRRILNANFDNKAFHLVLTYDPKMRAANPTAAKEDLAKFFRAIKARAKKQGKVVKYVAVSEYGKRSMHHHVVLDCGLTITEIIECWNHGRVHFTALDSTGDYSRLAEYLMKQSKKTFQDVERRVHAKRFCCSKNLDRPEPKVEIVKADSWREDPVAPKGYMVQQDTIFSYADKDEEENDYYTGWPYQYYRCIRIEGGAPC